MSDMNWSFIQHEVGDMRNDEEYQNVLVETPNGEILRATNMVKRNGQWILTTEPKEDA